MLVWLASYPRSGNTLLRQVLKTCFDLDSCEGLERVPDSFRTPDGIRDKFYGSYFVEGDSEAFYSRARERAELVLIKSHQLPRDDAKAIYVVRDGRLALTSYVKYQNTYHPGTTSFESLLVGNHAYGEWTSHYRAWAGRGGETLVLRFEELLNADAAMLARIANFLGVSGPTRPWVNPQSKLRELDPAFFGTGSSAWRPDPFWNETRLRQFHTLHGPLLAELGYASAEDVATAAYLPGSDEERLVRFARDLATRSNSLQTECDARADTLTRTKQMADEQIALLLEGCDKRDQLLTEMSQRLQEHARDAGRQLKAADARLSELDARLQRCRWWRRLPLVGTLRRLARR